MDSFRLQKSGCDDVNNKSLPLKIQAWLLSKVDSLSIVFMYLYCFCLVFSVPSVFCSVMGFGLQVCVTAAV